MTSSPKRCLSPFSLYLLGSKTTSGTERPAFVAVAIQKGTDAKKVLNLHPQPFERQMVKMLRPGQATDVLEMIPFDTFMGIEKGSRISAEVSLAKIKPQDKQVISPDALCWSNAVDIPWDQMKTYFAK